MCRSNVCRLITRFAHYLLSANYVYAALQRAAAGETFPAVIILLRKIISLRSARQPHIRVLRFSSAFANATADKQVNVLYTA
jgi:hypothetical protein